jgi:hypothetical protein
MFLTLSYQQAQYIYGKILAIIASPLAERLTSRPPPTLMDD